MLASISGHLIRADDIKIVIMQVGLGFEMLCPTARRLNLQSIVSLHTYMHWSAEQGPSLYGFETLLEKDLFLMLIDCSGIGPKLGISILQQTQPVDLIAMIASNNSTALSALKGLGAKKAEVLCMHLKDKVSNLLVMHPNIQKPENISVWHDLHETLVSLHYSTAEIKQATSMVKESVTGQNIPFDLLLRKTLMILAKK